MKFSGLLLLLVLCLVGCKSEKEPELKSKTGIVIPKDGKVQIKTGGVMTKDGALLNYMTTGEANQTLIVPNAVMLLDNFKTLSDQFTIIGYDLRNRGRSRSIKSEGKLRQGILNDVEDLEAIRNHFKLDKFSVVGHSYLGLMAQLYALKYPNRLDKIIQIGSISPFPDKAYSETESFADERTKILNESLQDLESKEAESPLANFCEEWWASARMLYLGGDRGAIQVAAGICRYPNEHPAKVKAYFDHFISPSIQQLSFTEENYKTIQVPTLIIHGKKDRIQPFGASQDWAAVLPNGELLLIEEGGHLPWIDAHQEVFGAIREFMQ